MAIHTRAHIENDSTRRKEQTKKKKIMTNLIYLSINKVCAESKMCGKLNAKFNMKRAVIHVLKA